jgi:hypothetical protein
MWDLWWTEWHWDRFSPVSFVPRMLHYTEKWKKKLIFITGLHNKPQGCGVSVASAAGPFKKKTTSMEQNPSWEANRSSASQDVLRVLWNPKFHYHIHKRLPPVPILSHINPVRAPHPTSWRSILLLSSHLHLGLRTGLLPSGHPTKTLCWI